MTKQDTNKQQASVEHLNRCLSMVIYHEEVQMMANAIERILSSPRPTTEVSEEE